MTPAQIAEKLERLNFIKKEMLDLKDEMLESTFSFGEYVEEITFIDKQISYLDKNIKTFEEALMCHETKIFEKRYKIKDLGNFCLN